MSQRIILYGAGKKGLEALSHIGEDVEFFCDNDPDKIGQCIEGKEVISFEQMLKLGKNGYRIVVTPIKQRDELCEQLKRHGIFDFVAYYSPEGLLENYENRDKNYDADYEKILFHLRETQSFNLLEDISEFKKTTERMMEDYKKLGKDGFIPSHYGGSGHYGNLESILQYAGIEEQDVKFFPDLSYMTTYMWCMVQDIKKGVMIAGERYKKFIHKYFSYVPVYTVGPYIHYAEGMYDEEKLKKEKEKYGKILTIFMPHSNENIKVGYQEKEFVDRILSKYKGKFDSIWACVYWADINGTACSYLEQKGIHVVCAGYRFDPIFAKRLKTILQLSDGIVCGDFGTVIGYALYMNKPVALFYTEQQYIDVERKSYMHAWQTGDYNLCTKGYKKVFNEELIITKEQQVFINEILGFDKIRDKSYFRSVLEISKDIWKMCGYDEARYPIGVYSAYDFYRRTGDIEKALILREAVGPNFI